MHYNCEMWKSNLIYNISYMAINLVRLSETYLEPSQASSRQLFYQKSRVSFFLSIKSYVAYVIKCSKNTTKIS